MESLPTDQIPARWTVDYRSNEIAIIQADGSTVKSPFASSALDQNGEIVRAAFDAANRNVEFEFSFGESVCLEVGPREVPRVPVVYLDQNKWIALAQSRFAPERLEKANLEPISRLYELAVKEQILLPISSAHMVETAHKDGQARQRLGTVMLELSRGWQMLNPLKVRSDEFLFGLGKGFGRTSDIPPPKSIITLDPGALFSKPQDPLPTGWPELKERFSWAEALADSFVEDERDADPDALSKVSRWASVYGEVGEQIRAGSASPRKRRTWVRDAVLTDNSGDFFMASTLLQIPAEDAIKWVRDSDFQFEGMPSTRLLFEITLRRLSSKDHHWKGNDLNDLTFLCCAAANCDLVLAENATSHDLRDAQRHFSTRAEICRSVDDLISKIEDRQSGR